MRRNGWTSSSVCPTRVIRIRRFSGKYRQHRQQRPPQWVRIRQKLTFARTARCVRDGGRQFGPSQSPSANGSVMAADDADGADGEVSFRFR